MKNIIILMVLSIAAANCSHKAMPSKTPYTNTEIISEQGDTILAGHCAAGMLQQGKYKVWYDKSYNAYTANDTVVQQIKPLLQHKKMEIFLGTWCGDSRRETPRMLNILNAAAFDTANLTIIFVDHADKYYKQSPQHEERGKNIFRVPTFIVYGAHGEMGRIIESPVNTLEKDLLAILQQQSYTPRYHVVHYWVQQVNERSKPMPDDKLNTLAAAIKPMCQNISPFNSYGYVLMAQKNYGEAFNVFKLNTLMFPAESNAFDSLGEAYLITGDKQNAKMNYEKALSLKPGDERIKKILEDL